MSDYNANKWCNSIDTIVYLVRDSTEQTISCKNNIVRNEKIIFFNKKLTLTAIITLKALITLITLINSPNNSNSPNNRNSPNNSHNNPNDHRQPCRAQLNFADLTPCEILPRKV